MACEFSVADSEPKFENGQGPGGIASAILANNNNSQQLNNNSNANGIGNGINNNGQTSNLNSISSINGGSSGNSNNNLNDSGRSNSDGISWQEGASIIAQSPPNHRLTPILNQCCSLSPVLPRCGPTSSGSPPAPNVIASIFETPAASPAFSTASTSSLGSAAGPTVNRSPVPLPQSGLASLSHTPSLASASPSPARTAILGAAVSTPTPSSTAVPDASEVSAVPTSLQPVSVESVKRPSARARARASLNQLLLLPQPGPC
jgi:hypothetical protein